jgi:hypothetical protein
LNFSVLAAQKLGQISVVGTKIFGSFQGFVMIFVKILDQSQIIVMCLPKFFKIFSGILISLFSNLLFVLALFRASASLDTFFSKSEFAARGNLKLRLNF